MVRDLPFEQYLNRTLRFGMWMMAGLALGLVWDYQNHVLRGLLMGTGVGLWNIYFLARRIKLVTSRSREFLRDFQKEVAGSLVVRLLSIVAVLYLASRISLPAVVAAAAGILAVQGIFAAMGGGALLREVKFGDNFRPQTRR